MVAHTHSSATAMHTYTYAHDKPGTMIQYNNGKCVDQVGTSRSAMICCVTVSIFESRGDKQQTRDNNQAIDNLEFGYDAYIYYDIIPTLVYNMATEARSGTLERDYTLYSYILYDVYIFVVFFQSPELLFGAFFKR